MGGFENTNHHEYLCIPFSLSLSCKKASFKLSFLNIDLREDIMGNIHIFVRYLNFANSISTHI